MSQINGKWVMLAALATAAILAGGCRQNDSPPPVAVRTMKIKKEAVSSELRLSATVRERHRVELSFKVPGTVYAIRQVLGPDGNQRGLHEGDVVTSDPNKPLARLDDSDYRRKVEGSNERLAQAKAKEQATQAALTAVEATYKRIKALRERESVSQQNYDEALAKRDSAKAELDAVGREVAGAKVALEQAKDDFENCSLESPIPEAVVSRKYVEEGERVQAGQPIFQIMDLSQVRVAFGVPDTKVDSFKIGQTVTVTADAFPGKRFSGRITKVVPAADLRTRTFEVETTIDDPGGLRPGMVVTIYVGRQEDKTLLPLTSVQRGATKDDYVVYAAVKENGSTVARKRRVALGGIYDNRIQLLNEGSQVGEGDVIVVTGAFKLSEGEKLRVIDVPEPNLKID